jgi:hypothetical protein
MPIFELLSRTAFGLLSLMLMLLTASLFVFVLTMLAGIWLDPPDDPGFVLLRAVGYIVVSIAIFEVAKYMFEEEVINPREMRHTGEARRSLTKFISSITIIVFLEALVAIFITATQENVALMLYPTLLLVAGIALVVGLGVYQRLSAMAEKETEQKDKRAVAREADDRRP